MKTRRTLWSPATVLCWMLTLCPLVAEKHAMGIVEMLEIPSLSSPQLSPDGRHILYVLGKADWEKNRRITHIWRIEADGGNAIQLTNGAEGESGPLWSPDGQRVSFEARRDGEETEIYLIRMQGGEAERLTNHETSVSRSSWSADGNHIYFLASDPKTAEEKKRDKLKDDVFAFDQNYKHRHLWRISISGKKEERLTEGDFSILSYELSRDGSRIVAHRAPTPLLDDSDDAEVWIMDADGGNPLQLTSNAAPESRSQISPDGRHVLFLSGANENFELYYNSNLFIVPSEGGKPRLPAPDFPYAISSAEWGPDSSSVFLGVSKGLEGQVFRINVDTGAYEQVTNGRHSIGGWDYSPELGIHVLSIDSPENPGDLWMLRPGESQLRRVTHIFDSLKDEFELPRQERVSWPGADGVEVDGILVYPVGYEDGKRYPLVVQTHGGPASADHYGFGDSTGTYFPVLAGKGFAVLRPNYRGSTGYGNAFLRDMVGQYFRNAHLDVLAGVDHVIGMGVADPDRLIKMGWSAGGHMTNKVITFTDRFKAASSGAGAMNWISMYAQSDVRIYRTPWFGGTPWQKDAPIDKYWENSPLKDVWRVKTPTLILVGQNDVRVPPPQSVELFRALTSNGVATRLYMAPREPHGWRELRHQLFKVNAELEWFYKYALEQDYEWESAPAKATEAVP